MEISLVESDARLRVLENGEPDAKAPQLSQHKHNMMLCCDGTSSCAVGSVQEYVGGFMCVGGLESIV